MSNITSPNTLASFPNSRIRPRKPTRQAFTYGLDALAPAVGVLDPSVDPVTETERGQQTVNQNTILAESNANRTYLTLRNVDPSEAIVYGYEDLPDLDTEGMILRAGDSVDLEATGIIYVRSLAITDVNCRIDYGVG